MAARRKRTFFSKYRYSVLRSHSDRGPRQKRAHRTYIHLSQMPAAPPYLGRKSTLFPLFNSCSILKESSLDKCPQRPYPWAFYRTFAIFVQEEINQSLTR